MKHTKGPWLNQNPHIVPEIRGIGYAICEINTLPHFHEEEQRANARLIAAAPTMYELLHRAADALEELLLHATDGGRVPYIFNEEEEVSENIKLLINKLEVTNGTHNIK